MGFGRVIASLNWDQHKTITLASILLHKLGGERNAWCFELGSGLNWLSRRVSYLAGEEVGIRKKKSQQLLILEPNEVRA